MNRTAQAAKGAPLAERVRHSLGWGLAGNVVGRLGSVLSGIVLARILEPTDYGVFAVALIGLLFILSLNDVGLAATIIAWPRSLDSAAPTAVTLILASSVLLYLALFAGAPVFAAAMSAPAATGVLRLLGISVIIDGVFAVPTVLLTRNFRQDRRTAADLIGLGLGIALTLVLALAGTGAWSLAWGRLAGNLASGILIAKSSSVLYAPGFDVAQALALLRFGIPLTGSSLVTFAISNLDYVVVGAMLGPIALGLYTLAVNLSTWPANLVLTAVRRVTLAGFSQIREDPVRLRVGFGRTLALLMAVALPACAMLSVFAAPLVTVLYGTRWLPSARPLAFLALAVALRMVFELVDDLMVAAGRPVTIMMLRVAWLATLLPGVALGAMIGGISGVGVGYLAAGLVVTPAFMYGAQRSGIRLLGLGRVLLRPTAGTLLMVGSGLVVLAAVPGALVQLMLGGFVAAALYIAVVLPMRHQAQVLRSMPGD